MLGILSMTTAVGYYKVFTTAGSKFADLTSHRGPWRSAPHTRLIDADRIPLRNTSQWIYPFTAETREAALVDALAKAEAVLLRMKKGLIVRERISGIDNAHAIRVR